MENKTHYIFALGLVNLYGLSFITNFNQTLLCFLLSFILATTSLIPNLLDHYAGADFRFDGVQLVKHRFSRRYRHPLLHSPWTLGYFLPFHYLASKISDPLLYILIISIELSWGSHIFLDSLNPEGVPIGRKPIFSNHLAKHYQWFQMKGVRSLRIANIPFNSLKANKNVSRIGLFFLVWNLVDLILNNYQEILEVLN